MSRERDQRLLEIGYSNGWSDHKKDNNHGMTPSQISEAIKIADAQFPEKTQTPTKNVKAENGLPK